MNLILTSFKQLLDLKINFHESELFYYGEASEYQDHYMEIFGCNMGEYPFRY